MDHISADPNCRYCVRMATLMVHFRKISRGPHQWLVRPLTGIFVSCEGEASRYLLTGYSNPKASGLPNNLVYAIPLSHFRAHREVDIELRVCWSPATAIPLLRGLYWKDGDLRYDPEKDMCRFWKPVERSLWEPAAAEPSKREEASKEPRKGPETLTLDGIAYIDSLTASLKWWAQKKEILQNAIQD
jgi:hypothetical protein